MPHYLPPATVAGTGANATVYEMPDGTRPEPFNFTPMAVNSISSGSPHVRPMGRTCGEPDEIKKNTLPKCVTALFRAAAHHTRRRALQLHEHPDGLSSARATRVDGRRTDELERGDPQPRYARE